MDNFLSISLVNSIVTLWKLSIFIWLSIYFLPTIVALFNNNNEKWIWVFLLNLFLWWTFIWWIIALAIAFQNDKIIVIKNENIKNKIEKTEELEREIKWLREEMNWLKNNNNNKELRLAKLIEQLPDEKLDKLKNYIEKLKN